MNKWFTSIVINEDVSKVSDAVQYFEQEMVEAKAECDISGSLEQASARLPGYFQYRYSQLQELEGILEYLNIELKKLRSISFREYKEKYDTSLTASAIEKYIDGEPDVVAWSKEINKVALIRNQYIGVTKSMDMKNFQIGHVTKLRAMGIEDAFLQ